MGCCGSTEGGVQPGVSDSRSAPPIESAVAPAGKGRPSGDTPGSESQPMSAWKEGGGGQASYIPNEAKGAKAFLPATSASNPSQDVSEPAAVPTSQSSGPKAVKGWAPPVKEWDKETKSKQDQTRFEIKEEWDEDGNLVRTTIKKTVTPDWKWKTEKTVDIIPAAEAAKMKKK